jgi:hypothetical protein
MLQSGVPLPLSELSAAEDVIDRFVECWNISEDERREANYDVS